MSLLEVILHDPPFLATKYISDVWKERRTWRERLFTRPWTPLRKYKTGRRPTALNTGMYVLVSTRTYNLLFSGKLKISDLMYYDC